MDFETCYVYKSAIHKEGRPNKRRRIEEVSGLHSSWPIRKSIYQREWTEQKQSLEVPNIPVVS